MEKSLLRIWNYKGVINREEKFMKMIKLAKKYKKVVNGHAPSLTGDLLKAYVSAGMGVSTQLCKILK